MSIEDRVNRVLEENGIFVVDENIFANMDSITYIQLIVDLEQTFKIEFPEQILIDMPKNIQGLVDLIKMMGTN